MDEYGWSNGPYRGVSKPRHRKEMDWPPEPDRKKSSLGNQLRRIASDIENHIAVSPHQLQDIAMQVDRLENPNG